jgi:hypothetical protein
VYGTARTSPVSLTRRSPTQSSYTLSQWTLKIASWRARCHMRT